MTIAKKRLPVFSLLFAILCAAMIFQSAHGQMADGSYSADEALRISQAAIGRELADLEFTDGSGKLVKLTDYRGKPLLVSLIFTSCHHVCPMLTRHLKKTVDAARDALGDDSFNIVTIGFDTINDTPEMMRSFAHSQGVNDPDWAFLSASAETMAKLVENVGFIYFPTAGGFDHITQLTVVSRDGVIYRQVYDGAFQLPRLMEPLKDLIYNRHQPAQGLLSEMVDKVKLFCTVYNPNTGEYRFDYSFFAQMAVGFLIVFGVFAYLLFEFFRARRRKKEANAC